MNDKYFDLGNLAVNNGFGEDDEQRLLAAYLDAEPTGADVASLRLMRLMSDVREAAVGRPQGVVSDPSTSTTAPTRPSTSPGCARAPPI